MHGYIKAFLQWDNFFDILVENITIRETRKSPLRFHCTTLDDRFQVIFAIYAKEFHCLRSRRCLVFHHLLRCLAMFPCKASNLHPLMLHWQIGSFGKPTVFLLQHLQADLIGLQSVLVAQMLVNQYTALPVTDCGFQLTLALGGFVAGVKAAPSDGSGSW